MQFSKSTRGNNKKSYNENVRRRIPESIRTGVIFAAAYPVLFRRIDSIAFGARNRPVTLRNPDRRLKEKRNLTQIAGRQRAELHRRGGHSRAEGTGNPVSTPTRPRNPRPATVSPDNPLSVAGR